MGALYIIGAMILAGIVADVVETAMGNSEVGSYDYHYAMGVGAVFGER